MSPMAAAGRKISGGRNPGGPAARTVPDVVPSTPNVGDPGARVKKTGLVSTAPEKTKLAEQSSRLTRLSGDGSRSPRPGSGGGAQAEAAKPFPSGAKVLGKISGGPKGWDRDTAAAP